MILTGLRSEPGDRCRRLSIQVLLLLLMATACAGAQRGFPSAEIPAWCVTPSDTDATWRAARLRLVREESSPTDLTREDGDIERLQTAAIQDLVARIDAKVQVRSRAILQGLPGEDVPDHEATGPVADRVAAFYRDEVETIVSGIRTGRIAYGLDATGQRWVCAEMELSLADHLNGALRRLEQKRAGVVEAYLVTQESMARHDVAAALPALARAWSVLRERVGGAPLLATIDGSTYDLQTRLPADLDNVLRTFRVVPERSLLVLARDGKGTPLNTKVYSDSLPQAAIPLIVASQRPSCAGNWVLRAITDDRGVATVEMPSLNPDCHRAQASVTVDVRTLLGLAEETSEELLKTLVVPGAIVRLARQRRIGLAIAGPREIEAPLSEVVASNGDLPVLLSETAIRPARTECQRLASADIDAVLSLSVHASADPATFGGWHHAKAVGRVLWLSVDTCASTCTIDLGPVDGDPAISAREARNSAIGRLREPLVRSARQCLEQLSR